ncbi:hypothetical protein BDV59DRAFT_205121 [Aspergillus ambiguus]|uniref:uncharacterized protein n=1 Tax=Aspergillus ambiguus TaxID=176160 RepID=UPI003CCDD928
MSKVALITGGASGIGLATAKSLSSKGWRVVVADINPAGEHVARDINAVFHKTDVGEYASLAKTFDKVWKQFGQLDFVFANAGIVEKVEFYQQHETDLPPALDTTILDINLKSVVATCYLALHFMRKNKTPGGNIIITASCGGVYPIAYLPMYASAKHGCVGLTRSLAKAVDRLGIRVNCICPASVGTGLLKPEEWDEVGRHEFTPVERVVEAVEGILEDKSINGGAVEIVRDRRFFRPAPEHWDPAMKRVIDRTEALAKL